MARLLADALGGNSMTLLLAGLVQGEAEVSLAVLRVLRDAQEVMTWPVRMDQRARGLLRMFRAR